MTSEVNVSKGAWFVYDGECPLCQMGVTYYRLRENLGELYLQNMREMEASHPLMAEIKARGIDLNQGMVFKVGGVIYQGADALNAMAIMSSGHGWINRVNATLFRYKSLACLCYPAMKFGRTVALRIKGVQNYRACCQLF